MEVKSINQIMQNIKNRQEEQQVEDNVVYGDEFERWLKEQKNKE